MPCDMMEFMGSNLTYYPQCTAGGTETAVEANMYVLHFDEHGFSGFAEA